MKRLLPNPLRNGNYQLCLLVASIKESLKKIVSKQSNLLLESEQNKKAKILDIFSKHYCKYAELNFLLIETINNLITNKNAALIKIRKNKKEKNILSIQSFIREYCRKRKQWA